MWCAAHSVDRRRCPPRGWCPISRRGGFRVAVAAAGRAGLERLTREPYDALVLDLMLPDMDGLEVCRQLRAKSDLPVLMLTARGEAMDRVVGLEIGADDYLPKPFEPRELLARLRAILRRRQPGGPTNALRFGRLRSIVTPASCESTAPSAPHGSPVHAALALAGRPAACCRGSPDGSRQGRGAGGLRPIDDVHISRIRAAIETTERPVAFSPCADGTSSPRAGLMRRLYLDLFAVLVSLAVFALCSALVWRQLGDAGPQATRSTWRRRSRRTCCLRPGRRGPSSRRARKVRRQSAGDVALFATIARCSLPSASRCLRRARAATEGAGYTLGGRRRAIHLPDGRWLSRACPRPPASRFPCSSARADRPRRGRRLSGGAPSDRTSGAPAGRVSSRSEPETSRPGDVEGHDEVAGSPRASPCRRPHR